MQGSGGCSSVGRVQDCDSCCRGFEPHQPPQYLKSRVPFGTRDFFFGGTPAIRSGERPGVTIRNVPAIDVLQDTDAGTCFKLFAGHPPGYPSPIL